MTYKRCKRKWWFSSSNHQRLTPRLTGLPFSLGRNVHSTLAHWTVNPDLPLPELTKFYSYAAAASTEEAEQVYRDAVGTTANDAERQAMHLNVDLGLHMVQNYFTFWGHPIEPGWQLVAGSEQEFLVDIPGTPHKLKGFLDHAVTGPLNKMYAVDRKTYATRPNTDLLPYDEQFIAYTWVLGVLHSFDAVAGIAYDGLWKRKVPNFKAGLDWKDLFCRLTVKPTPDQLNEFNTELPIVATEMASFGATVPGDEYNPIFYKNHRGNCSWDCKEFVKPCHALSQDDDIDSLLQLKYRTRDLDEDRALLAAAREVEE